MHSATYYRDHQPDPYEKDEAKILAYVTKAVENKFDLIARKLKIEPGMRILDVGCGFGKQLKYIAENYKNVECVGINISASQVKEARIQCAGLPVEIKLAHCLDIEGKFDRIMCVEMMLHLGPHNIQELLKKVNECLTDDGIFFAHCIQRADRSLPVTNPWIDDNVYAGVYLPFTVDFVEWSRRYFALEDVQSLGLHYGTDVAFISALFENKMKANKDKDPEKMEKYPRLLGAMAMQHGAFYSRGVELYHYIFTKKSTKKFYLGER